MKKVLFTATVDSHILQFHLPFLKYFKDNGYEVHVATNGDEEIPYCDKKIKISFERSPLKLNNLKAIKELKKVIDVEKYDIIHTHTPMGSVVTRLAAKKARKKYHTRVIYTAHGFHFFKGAPIKNWLIFYPVEKYLSKYTDTLITINQEDYELAKNKFKKCKDIEYVPGVGIDEEKFNFKMSNKEKSELRKSLGLKDDNFVLTCVARLDANKNQGFLINVMNALVVDYPNIHLLLVGPDEFNGKYQEQAKDMLSNIHFLGYRNDIPKLLKITDVSVSSSLREGLPVNILEAMASGVPVVATDARGVRDLIKNDVNGYVADSKDEFIDIILKLYNNEKLCNGFSKNNLKDVKEYYLDNILEKMQSIYNKKKTVLHLLASNKYSGAENVACTIINNMHDNYNMLYCSPNGSIKKKLKELNIKFLPIKKLSINETKKIVKNYNVDIIHAHDFKASYYSALFSKKCKVISHIHQNPFFLKTINLKSVSFYLITKMLFKVIFVTDQIKDDYVFYSKSKNIVVIKNTISTNYIQSMIKSDNNDYNLFDLIFLGRLTSVKNPLRFVKIASDVKKEIPNLKVAIVGDGEMFSELKLFVKEKLLEDNITFFGFMNNPYKVLSNSKILILTSLREGLPMCVLEAQSLGIPVVSTPADGIKSIISNGYNGFLSDNDYEIVDFIINTLKNAGKLKSLHDNSLLKFDSTNSINNYIDKIDELYNDLD